MAKVVAPYDNTGYRSFPGTALAAFDDEDECREHFKTQCNVVIEALEQAKVDIVKHYEKQIIALHNFI
jgi:hypothetical protein